MATKTLNIAEIAQRLHQIEDERATLDKEEGSLRRELVTAATQPEYRERMDFMVRSARTLTNVLSFVLPAKK